MQEAFEIGGRVRPDEHDEAAEDDAGFRGIWMAAILGLAIWAGLILLMTTAG